MGMGSEVFQRMLTTDMQESQQSKITLVGKAKVEFREVLRFFDINTMLRGEVAEVTKDNVHVLLRWSDEYEMKDLRERCEGFLLSQPKRDVETLLCAVHFHLEKLKDSCLRQIKRDVVPHIEALAK